MKTTVKIALGFCILMGLAYLNVAVQALFDPRAVMANVGVTLENPSALSSIRAVYGGMHLAFAVYCFFGAFRARRAALTLVALYAGGFVLGRLVSWSVDGAPNTFVSTWLITESVCCIVSLMLIRQLNGAAHKEPSKGLSTSI